MTVSVRAGTPLRALDDELAPHGQHVAFDAARVADGATVGGLVATADAGPRALVLRLAAGPGHRRDAGAGRRHGGPQRRARDQERGRLRPGQAGARLLRHARPCWPRWCCGCTRCRRAAARWPCRLPAGRGRRAGRHGAGRPVRARRPGVDHGPGRRRHAAGPARGHPRTPCRPAGSETPAATALARRPAQVARGAVAQRRRRGGRGRARPGQRAAGPWARHAALTRGDAGRAPCCGSGCGRASCPGCSTRCPATAVTAGLGTGVATVTLAPEAVADAHARRARRRRHLVLRARPAGRRRCRPGGRRRRRLPCCAPSRPSWTRTAASAPAASTPGWQP